MLDYTILNLKKQLKPDSTCNETRYDMLSRVISSVNVAASDIIMVNEYYVARPDLISLAVYGDDKYADFICKYNGISNPFEMNEGDIIYLPSFDKLSLMVNDNITGSEIIEDNNSPSMNIKEFAYQKEYNERRSPAEQVVGETNFVIDKSMGVVFY